MSSRGFQGGHNAGHTLVVDGVTYKLHALPSGVVRGGKLSVIGNGVVLDPWHLVKEIETVRAQGVDISPETLMIAENTPLILPVHGELGSRARGAKSVLLKLEPLGVASVQPTKIRWVAVLFAWPIWLILQRLEARVDRLLLHHNTLRRGLGMDRSRSCGRLIAQLHEIAPEILKYAAPVWKVLNEKRKAGKRILFEGAQGALLDIDFGTYPFVTSSNVLAGQASAGTGIGPNSIDFVSRDRQGIYNPCGRGAIPN